MELEENAHNDLLLQFQKEGVHYSTCNTHKELILDFYDCKNDNFHVKIVIVLLLLFIFWLKNKVWVHQQFIVEQKSEKECIPLSEPQSFYIKVWYMRWSKLHERVFMIKRF